MAGALNSASSSTSVAPFLSKFWGNRNNCEQGPGTSSNCLLLSDFALGIGYWPLIGNTTAFKVLGKDLGTHTICRTQVPALWRRAPHHLRFASSEQSHNTLASELGLGTLGDAPCDPQCFCELSYLMNLFKGTASFKACWGRREYQLMYTLQIWWVSD